MTRIEKEFGDRSNDDIIREILRACASRENPIGRKEIIKYVKEIELKVNLNSFTFWVLQYSGCVEVLDRGKKGEKSYRNRIEETLKKALEKYEDYR